MPDKKVYILLDSVRSLYNVGSIFRIADAVGVKKIFLTGISGVEKFGEKIELHPKLKKTALEGIDVYWEYTEDPIEKIKELKTAGIEIVSLELTDKSTDYRKTHYNFPLCLIVGHERIGVDDKVNQLSDKIVFIPMYGKGKSLNVAVSTAVALYHLLSLP